MPHNQVGDARPWPGPRLHASQCMTQPSMIIARHACYPVMFRPEPLSPIRDETSPTPWPGVDGTAKLPVANGAVGNGGLPSSPTSTAGGATAFGRELHAVDHALGAAVGALEVRAHMRRACQWNASMGVVLHWTPPSSVSRCARQEMKKSKEKASNAFSARVHPHPPQALRQWRLGVLRVHGRQLPRFERLAERLGLSEKERRALAYTLLAVTTQVSLLISLVLSKHMV